MGDRVWPWSRRRWRPAWTTPEATILATELRHAMTYDRAPPMEGPYRMAGLAHVGPATRLASLVYAGELLGANRVLIRRLEIDPADGRAWVLWQHTFPPGMALGARTYGRIENLVLVPLPAGGVAALDIYTGKPKWQVEDVRAPVDEMLLLPSGRLRVWLADK